MRIYQLDVSSGTMINQFNSAGAVYARILRTDHKSKMQAGCFYIRQDGIVGHHEAILPQLLLVVSGEGWVAGSDGKRKPISEWQAAFWEKGEWHSAGSSQGMMAIVIEDDALTAQDIHMPEFQL
jgi:quercetin dioxygenase-like cupin family protein